VLLLLLLLLLVVVVVMAAASYPYTRLNDSAVQLRRMVTGDHHQG